MESLVGASLAALALYDMCKSVSHEITIQNTHLMGKKGGKRDFGFTEIDRINEKNEYLEL